MASGPPPSILSLLRRAAPTLSRHFFAARKCPNDNARATTRGAATFARAIAPPQARRSLKQSPFLTAFRSQSSAAASVDLGATPLSRLGNAIEAETANAYTKSSGRTRSSPEVSHRGVGLWLLSCAAGVYGIVVLGGLTRLTESGLSITEWRPVTGSIPPMSAADWDLEFDKYKASPEFQKLNPNMDLHEFKKIFWMEWSHRLAGRLLGLGVLLPTIYFVARRQVTWSMARNLALINGLIGLQGFVGWWMVKSGLKDDLFAKGAHPRVSQYRLAVHLGLAFTVYSAMVWNGLNILRENKLLQSLELRPGHAESSLTRLSQPILRVFRRSAIGLTAFVFVTAMSGALVAGLDAGLIYNEFPYMGLGLAPPASELWDPFYSREAAPHADLWWRNMLENPSLVQLDHRILATTAFTAVHALAAYARFSPAVRAALPRGARRALAAALGLVWLQATLGITTLLYLVPVPLAAAHQAGSLALLTAMLVLVGRVRAPARVVTLVHARGAALSSRMATPATLGATKR